MAETFICRLCLEHSENLLEIFCDRDGAPRIDDVLSYYSIIDLKPDDAISKKICISCWSKVNDFHEFCVRVQKIQESISSIIYVDTRNDVNEVVLANVIEEEEPNDPITFIEVKDEEIVETIDVVIGEDADKNQFDLIEMSDTTKVPESMKVNVKIEPCRLTRSSRRRSTKPLIEEESHLQKAEDEFIEKRRRARRKTTEEESSNEELINSYFTLNCELCQASYNCCAHLFGHYEGVHKIRGFIMCCGKKFFKKPKVAEHVLWHKNPELFRCTKCDLETVFPDKKHLEAHMVTHVDCSSNVFHCEFCNKSFMKKYRYDQHKLTHLRPEEKKFICPDCGNRYATEALLRVHIRVVHIKSYAHMCEICAKVFKSRVFFEKHQLEHMGQSLPRVQCQVCNAWMKNEHTMRAHMRLHEDAGVVHECELCGKTGPSRSAILKHKRYVHFSEKKFKCTLCEKAFKRAVALKEHMTLHTGEVLYKCTFCTKTFNSGANMFAHKKKVHYSEWKMEKEQNTK